MSVFTQLKTHKFSLVVGIIVVGGVAYYFSRPPLLPNYETTTVKQGDVIQEVSITGRVNAESEAELAFEKSGRVLSVPTPVGAKVNRGDVLVRLDATELTALSAQARANIAYEIANLAQLKRGSRAEDIAVSVASVAGANLTVDDTRTTLFDKLELASTAADDAIFNKTDYLFDNPRAINPRVLFPVTDQKLVARIEQSRAALSEELKELSVSNGDSDLEKRLAIHKKYFSNVKNYLDDLASAVNSVLASSQNPQSTIDGWKATVSLARTSVSSATSALLLAEQAYRSAESALTVVVNQLELKKVGPTPESLLAQDAKIGAMQAALENYDAQIAKMILRAPFTGIITKQDTKMGQTVSPGVPVVSLQGVGKFQIEANVPEVDVAKISVGDEAEVTLDAYGSDEKFSVVVATIDPAETIVEGVSTYKVTLQFVKNDERIRSGMTANIDISTDKRAEVLFIPSRAVTTRDGKKYVKLLDSMNAVSEKEITVGLRGSDGSIEVQSGIVFGDTIVTFEPK